ncbi:Secondary metabolism regulator LAE1 [Trichoderma lentiforme]|uniref:Secondary metabolism regulator LAE1 n=1 Tax=Trichoderma lentiforme TaxID=1567552 RepID=A0A9P4XJF8_9HYPO|nr:Secondary metabolism regulator LAE1 [Trichoderma lentiforme]
MAVESIPPAGESVIIDDDHEQGEKHNDHDAAAKTDDEEEEDAEEHEHGEEDEEEVEGLEDHDDEDDATASDSNSNYSSASEDALPPIHEYGHVYHGSGRMVTPNDPCENQRQAYQHELFTLCLGGALTFTKLPLEHLSPDSPRFHILDVGCGGGHWGMEMAQSNPLVDVLGIELSSANLPKEVPPNLTFEIADAAEDWPPRLYDFIHLRNLVGGGIRDWRRLIVQAFDHLKPGGQLEFTEVTPLFFGVDPDPTSESSDDADTDAETDQQQAETEQQRPRAALGAATIEYGAVFAEIAAAQGIDFDPTPKVRPWLRELGAESVRERSDWMPVRNWARDPVVRKKGEILYKMLETGCNHWTLRMFGLAGWEEAKTRELLDRVMKEYDDPLLRSCIKVTFISARKPGGKSTKTKTAEKTQ